MLSLYQPRGPQDASRETYHERLTACRLCSRRRGGTCVPAGTLATVHARPATARCPLGRWPGSKKGRAESGGLRAESQTSPLALRPPPPLGPPPKSLAVLTCHFNPQRYRRPVENYRRFAEAVAAAGVDLWTMELAFDDDPFELPKSGPGNTVVCAVRGTRADNLLWQKERLLNLLIDEVNGRYDALAWIDADVLFARADWPAAILKSLETHAVVQPWEGAYTLYPDGRCEELKRSTGWHWKHAPHAATDVRVSHPGFAWAARADWLHRHGLSDSHATGGGDTLMMQAFCGGQAVPIHDRLGPAWRAACDRWTAAVEPEIQGRFGYVCGALFHLYHGSRTNRRYAERWDYLTRHDFDPAADLAIDANGLWAWSEAARREKPRMIDDVAAYFMARREDD